MSIFATWLLLAEDGGSAAPVVYQGSHVNPSDDDPRAGRLEIAAIPNHCHPDVRFRDPLGSVDDPADAHGLPVEFLRLSVDQPTDVRPDGDAVGRATVILDRAQVEHLHSTLAEWLGTDER
ncbi:hypothetical protein ACWCPT_28470 [Streptomyces sp. NPDC002308]